MLTFFFIPRKHSQEGRVGADKPDGKFHPSPFLSPALRNFQKVRDELILPPKIPPEQAETWQCCCGSQNVNIPTKDHSNKSTIKSHQLKNSFNEFTTVLINTTDCVRLHKMYANVTIRQIKVLFTKRATGQCVKTAQEKTAWNGRKALNVKKKVMTTVHNELEQGHTHGGTQWSSCVVSCFCVSDK